MVGNHCVSLQIISWWWGWISRPVARHDIAYCTHLPCLLLCSLCENIHRLSVVTHYLWFLFLSSSDRKMHDILLLAQRSVLLFFNSKNDYRGTLLLNLNQSSIFNLCLSIPNSIAISMFVTLIILLWYLFLWFIKQVFCFTLKGYIQIWFFLHYSFYWLWFTECLRWACTSRDCSFGTLDIRSCRMCQ